MWLNDLFWGICNTFVGKYHFLVINDHLWWPSVHVDKSFKKIQAGVRPPPIQAMPVFWELLDRQPIPKEEKVIFYESLNVQKQARWSLLYISAGLRRMRGSLIKQSGACPPHPSLALLQVTEPQIWGLYHCGQNRGEELSKIRYICGLNLLVRDGQWSRSTMINNIRSYP